jgi:hypothetical protein
MTIPDFSGVQQLKETLDRHPIYEAVHTLEDLRSFMEHHVYSVWDFMSLLKSLQRSIAPTNVPWLPTDDQVATSAQRFINEIVLGEETDEGLGKSKSKPNFISHFDLYVGAMEDVGANTKPVREFLKSVKRNGLERALQSAKIPEPSRRFMKTTFSFIATEKPYIVASVFALGREQIIPGMFRALIANMGISKKKAPLFHYYLERHVHLDDELHGPLSLQLLGHLCGEIKAKQQAAAKAGRDAIQARITFWDEVHSALPSVSK